VTNWLCGFSVIGTKDKESGQWQSTILSSVHNGENPAEADKMKKEHPNEPECFFDERVLGAIAVTRCTPLQVFLIIFLLT
jgi:pyruvate dehydrogenase phosphatase